MMMKYWFDNKGTDGDDDTDADDNCASVKEIQGTWVHSDMFSSLFPSDI